MYRALGRGDVVVERRTLNSENSGSNPLAAVFKLWQIRSPPHYNILAQLFKRVPGYRQVNI